MLPAVASLHVYPVKSLNGFSPPSWEVDAFGLRLDRRWMVVDANGLFLSQRTHPRMALGRATPDGVGVRLEAPGLQPLAIPPGLPGERLVAVRIWKDRCTALPCGAAADAWVSRLVGERCRLVYMDDATRRLIEPNDAGASGRVAFSDAYPLLLLSQASLDALNARLDVPVPMNRFRPNVVIAGVAPHAEDGWAAADVEGLELVVAKPCARCVLTTVDQATGVAGVEPLRTLSTYRRGERGVLFGQNVVPRTGGRLAAGMTVTPRLAEH